MCKKIFISLILGISITSFADSVVQTDWSGGPGIWGPVIEFGNEFSSDTDVDYLSTPGDVQLQIPAEHIVYDDFYLVNSVYTEDINGDGFMDVLGAASGDDDITWWENVDGTGLVWAKYTIHEQIEGACCVYSQDIDGDGDMDVLGADSYNDDIIWWENTNGAGTSWTMRIVDGDFDGACHIYAEDIDGDGDMDLIGSAFYADDIAWWENLDGSGTSWNKQIIAGNFDYAYCVYSQDIDGDGDMDVLGAAAFADDITWWENADGSGESWIEHNVDDYFDHPLSVYSEDIDNDGDFDILAAGYYADDITWWENLDGSGTSWTEHTIDGSFEHPYSVHSEDLDGDGDMDVIGGSDRITWWENIDGSGTSWIEHVLDGDYQYAMSLCSGDINGDGKMDVLGASHGDDEITWWNVIPEGCLESSVFDTQGETDWDYLNWNSQTPAGTSVSFQVRSSDDHTNMGAWSDTIFTPCSLEGILTEGDLYVQYRVVLETSDPDTTPALNDITISWNLLGIGESSESIPSGTMLLSITPNPTAGAPVASFSLPEPALVNISIFNISGRLITEIYGDEYSQGYHDVLLGEWSPGIYFCRMTSGEFSATQRFVVIE